ncbi:MAG: hypothetical protein LAN36_09640 [Acidobacteriia bacterium]|nr:hypothetical protein [Terriglobia bacterium]
MAGNPYGKDAFKYGSDDNIAMRDLAASRAERAARSAPSPRPAPIYNPPSIPSAYPQVQQSSTVRGSSGRGGFLASLAKLIVAGVIFLAVVGYFESKPSGSAPSATPREPYPAQVDDATQAAPQAQSEQTDEPSPPSQPVNDGQADPAAPATAPRADSQAETPTDDPIGQGGFITPPQSQSIDSLLCVPLSLVNSFSWDNPPQDGEISAFKNYVFHYIHTVAKDNMRFKIRDDAYGRFDQGWRASTAYAPPPETLVQSEQEGQACSETDQAYQLTIHAR